MQRWETVTGLPSPFNRLSPVTVTGFTVTVFTSLHWSLSPVFTGYFHHSPSPASIAQYDYDIESIGIIGISFD